MEKVLPIPRHVDEIVEGLTALLHQLADKRVVVLGTTCTGKSTLLASIPEARDQDAEVFPKLTAEESEYVCQTPWTPEIGTVMTRLVRERVTSEVGKPLFGTVLVDADIIVLLKISDELLRKRVISRNVRFEDAKSMQNQIIQDVSNSGIPSVEFSVG